MCGGRVDMVMRIPDTIYVLELKEQREQNHGCMNSAESRATSSESQLKVYGTAKETLEQIDSKGYAIPYQTDERPVVKIDVKFDAEKHVPEEWVISNNKETDI